jgi:hypothetical protein
VSGKFDLSEYKDVAERIRDFRDLHPYGSLQSEVLRFPSDDLPFVVVMASAYRSPDDQRPGIGLAWEPFPGRTPYTKDSELQNAETSAWGRAIVAALASDTKQGVASADEIRARRSEPHSSPPGGATARRGSDTAGTEAARPASVSAPPSGDKPGAAEGPGDGEAPGPKAAHVHTFTDEPFEYDGKAIPVRKGWEVCTGCLNGRRKAA